jgi:hypothetical protein
MSYGANLRDEFRSAAGYVAKILRMWLVASRHNTRESGSLIQRFLKDVRSCSSRPALRRRGRRWPRQRLLLDPAHFRH